MHTFFILLTGHLMVFIFDIEYVCMHTYRKKTNSITNQTTTTETANNSPSHFRRLFCCASEWYQIEKPKSSKNCWNAHKHTHSDTHEHWFKFKSNSIPKRTVFDQLRLPSSHCGCLAFERVSFFWRSFYEYKWTHVKFISSINLEQKRFSTYRYTNK